MKYLIIIILSISSLLLRASSDFNANCQNAYSDIICLRFDDARSKISSEKILHPENSIPYLLDNYINFLTVMISEEDKDFKTLQDQKNKNLQHLINGNQKSPWFLYCQSEIYLQSGMAKIKFQEYVSGGLDINRAYRLLSDNEKKFPGFIPAKIRMGLLHCLVGTVHDQYKWAANALDFEGSIPQGIKELKFACNQCLANPSLSIHIPEAFFMLSFVSINLSGERNAPKELISEFANPSLKQWVSKSPLMTYCLANIYQKAARTDEAISLLDKFHSSPNQFPFYYLYYVAGVAKLNRLDNDAHLPLLKYLASFKGKNYIRSAYQHLAWYYYIQGNQEKYNLYMDRIFLRGNKQVDNDVQALQNAEKRITPDINLLKARLLFDGGYYERSLEMLNQFSVSKSYSASLLQLEYTYRMGRLMDEWGKIQEAKNWYNKTIQTGSASPSYFAANASLHLGMIFEQAGQTAEAKKCYQRCLDLDFTEYHFSITHKAKSGLNRLKN